MTLSIVLNQSVNAPGARQFLPTIGGTSTGFPARDLFALYRLNDSNPANIATDAIGQNTATAPIIGIGGAATNLSGGGVKLTGLARLPLASGRTIDVRNPFSIVMAGAINCPSAANLASSIMMTSDDYPTRGHILYTTVDATPANSDNLVMTMRRSVDGAQSANLVIAANAASMTFGANGVFCFSHDGHGQFSWRAMRAGQLVQSSSMVLTDTEITAMAGPTNNRNYQFRPAVGAPNSTFQNINLDIEAFAIYQSQLDGAALGQAYVAGAALAATRGRAWS